MNFGWLSDSLPDKDYKQVVLHEFGHAFFAMISGGHVYSLCVNLDGSGVTTTSGGSSGLLTMGGYIGSALFGNMMIALSKSYKSNMIFKLLSALMIISAIFWYNNITTTTLLVIYGTVMFIVSVILPRDIQSFLLTFLGVASVIYIIQDFNVGPTSDLQAYESEVGILLVGVSAIVWFCYFVGSF